MSKLVGALITTVVVYGLAFSPWPAAAETDADKAALQQATASCKAEVKGYEGIMRCRGGSGTRWSKNA